MEEEFEETEIIYAKRNSLSYAENLETRIDSDSL